MLKPAKNTRPRVLQKGKGVCGALALVAAAVIGVSLLSRRDHKPRHVSNSVAERGTPEPIPRLVGSQVCIECHEQEGDRWRGSHHALAMQPATEQTVLGDFNHAKFTYYDVTSTFSKKGNKFFVQTDGADGKLHEFEIVYTFGIDPLQQYLIAFPDGRLQALNICWDTRPVDKGGQRWFHLYPDERIAHDDILHWTGPYQNWNHMCAECHSTNVRKNYNAATDGFATSWSEINVACEACHGPGSGHVAWADPAMRQESSEVVPRMGFVVSLKESAQVSWTLDRKTGTAQRTPPRASLVEIEMCARCHSRRGTFSEEYIPGQLLMDTHRPALLEPALYEFDGQIKDEVYEYQSFLQSKMYAAGVTCTDCHNPHTLKMPSGNAICATCHLADKFDGPSHHFHQVGGDGPRCVECHAPTKNYMVVHARHDHSFRVPRPDLTVKIGVPNACNQCHLDSTAQWAAEMAAMWWGTRRASEPHYGEVLAAGSRNLPGAEPLLASLVDNAAQPAIVRASAADQLGDVLGPASFPILIRSLSDREPMLRAAAANAFLAVDPTTRAAHIAPLLSDPVRMVRMDAARALAAAPSQSLTIDQRKALGRALEEFRNAQRVDADRAEAHLNLGALHVDCGETQQAEAEYLMAIRLSPRFPATYVNLADLYRASGREADCERVLRYGLKAAHSSADLEHALGLSLVRQRRLDEAITSFQRAVELSPDVARYAYVYGVALFSAGDRSLGLTVLKEAFRRHPGDADILSSLVTFSVETGAIDDAVSYGTRLAELRPHDLEVQRLVEQVRALQERGRPNTPP